MPQATEWTAAAVRTLPDDGKRYEVVDGELLVTPSPTRDHQRIVGGLLVLLDPFVAATGLGEAVTSPSDVELDAHGLVQPDVFVQGLVDGRPGTGWNSGAPLLLVIEVLSPATARADRTVKRRRYQRAGVPEYWIVDTDARVVERWRPSDTRPEILAESLEWTTPGAAESLTIDLPTLFARMRGERS
jgi:Uma2 family endonuclease